VHGRLLGIVDVGVDLDGDLNVDLDDLALTRQRASVQVQLHVAVKDIDHVKVNDHDRANRAAPVTERASVAGGGSPRHDELRGERRRATRQSK
jgi:hypothetical protein